MQLACASIQDSDPLQRQNTLLRPLIAAAAGGDVKAFEQVYRQTVRCLLSRVRSLVGESLAEDVISEVYMQVWRSLPAFDVARGQPMAWLLTIARTRALDRLRVEVRAHGGTMFPGAANEDAADIETDGPEQLLARSQVQQTVRDVLARLNATERAVLGLAYFRDCSDAQIAASLGMPLGTVKSLIRRSHAKLRKALAPLRPMPRV